MPHLGTWLYEVWAVAAPRTSDYGFWDSLEGYRTRGRVGLASARNRTAIREAFRPRLCFVAPNISTVCRRHADSPARSHNRTTGLGLGTRPATHAAAMLPFEVVFAEQLLAQAQRVMTSGRARVGTGSAAAALLAG